MINSSAYLLVVHGSRNVNYGKQLQQLAHQIQLRLEAQNKSVFLSSAYLELTNKPLAENIISFAQQSASLGYQSVKILPLFLLSGTHVINDIPEQIALASIDSPLPLQLMPHIGTSDNLIALLRSQFSQTKAHQRILLAHGTSIKQANQELEKITIDLQAKVAYWSIEPNFIDVVEEMTSTKSEQEVVAVLPYFLFTGKITETIVSQINNLPSNISKQITLLPTLAQTEDLVDVISDLLLSSNSH